MRINAVNEEIQIQDRLHIFATSKRSARMCLDVLNSNIIHDCVINSQSKENMWLCITVLVSDPFTSTSIPNTISFLNIIPEDQSEMARPSEGNLLSVNANMNASVNTNPDSKKTGGEPSESTVSIVEEELPEIDAEEL